MFLCCVEFVLECVDRVGMGLDLLHKTYDVAIMPTNSQAPPIFLGITFESRKVSYRLLTVATICATIKLIGDCKGMYMRCEKVRFVLWRKPFKMAENAEELKALTHFFL